MVVIAEKRKYLLHVSCFLCCAHHDLLVGGYIRIRWNYAPGVGARAHSPVIGHHNAVAIATTVEDTRICFKSSRMLCAAAIPASRVYLLASRKR